MGNYFSQEEEEIEIGSPKDEGCSGTTGTGTPHVSSFAKLFTFVNDPRSPNANDFSRTPILVQEPLVDPRSPGNELVDRTPLYDAASTPIVRYKLDNEGYQASPAIPVEEEQVENNEGFRNSSSSISNEAYQHSPAIPSEQSRGDGIEDIDEDYDFEIIGEKVEEIAKNTSSKIPEGNNRENKVLSTKTHLKKRFNATQKSILKTVLFKPYEELTGEELYVASGDITPKKKPLGLRNDGLVSGDVGSTKKSTYGSKRIGNEVNSPSYKLPLRELSLCDKENMV